MKSNNRIQKMKFIYLTNLCCALLIASSDGTILRLPCKVFADFNVIHIGQRLLHNVLTSFYGLEDTLCMAKCVEHEKCRSYNINRKDRRCEINGKALADNGTILKTDSDWVYKSTNYSWNLVGPVCTSLNPCGDKILCKDSCDPPYYKCVYCDADHEGLHCDVAIDWNECSSNPCQNSGTCVDKFADYQCTCVNGYTGKNCETDVDECSSLPCLNGGSCINEIGNYTCNCTPAIGYTGRNCEREIDECSSNPCQNSGTCVEKFAAYQCACLSGFTGVNCETDIDECSSPPCLNGGSCINEIGNYTCNCTTAIGYTGRNCESDIDECTSSPCLDGGDCINKYGNYSCKCPSAIGYIGRNCEKGQFIIYQEYLSWDNARKKCVDRGGDLASIGTAEEFGIFNELSATSTANMWIWIGLNDRATENEFIWSDGTSSIFPQWGDKEPNGERNENCAFVTSQEKRLHDVTCSRRIYYMCEFT